MNRYAVVLTELGFLVIDTVTKESMCKPGHYFHARYQAQREADKLNAVCPFCDQPYPGHTGDCETIN